MALSNNRRRARGHFWIRLAGLTGLLVLVLSLIVYATGQVPAAWWAVLGGGVLAALALLLEIKEGISLLVSRRGAFGLNVLVQIFLASVLLAGVNAFSFLHYSRWDWTRDREFTLTADPTLTPELQQGLKQLRQETRIVVYQRHTPFGQQAGQQDNYAAAAERKIVEKVKDLAEQFQELGPRFRVEILDSQEEGFQGRLEGLRQEAPTLARAIETAPEDSIFFYAEGHVQRLAFHDIYQLDRAESEKAPGNLVLRFQGRGPFARKILNLEERPPRLAVAVIHEVLGMDNDEELTKDYGMSGAKKSLVSRGFQTQDIILKKWSEFGPPEPVVLTYDENRYQELDDERNELAATIKSTEEAIRQLEQDKRFWTQAKLEEINQRYTIVVDATGTGRLMEKKQLEALERKIGQKLRHLAITEEARQQVLRNLETELALVQLPLQQARQEQKEIEKQLHNLKIENLAELRRVTDLRAKLRRLLDDCDVLLVPRMTLRNVARDELNIPYRLHRLDEAQGQAIREFLAAGKPVLFCFGPSNEPPGRFDPAEGQGPDPLDQALQQLGFELPKQTILFTSETKSFGERRGNLLILSSAHVEIPPVEFSWRSGSRLQLPGEKSLPANPLSVSLELAAQSLGKEAAADLRLRHPRPVYYQPWTKDSAAVPKFDPVFLLTAPEAWNESQPFPTAERTPRFEPPKEDDPDRGTVRERRLGQFPIGVAALVKVPADFARNSSDSAASSAENSEKSASKEATARVVVIGHGGIFRGPTLSPLREKMLLDVLNWLLGREELLSRDSTTWRYPRVSLSQTENLLWQLGTRLGLPLLFIYLGLVVWMVRRLR
jgi:hypothetical protein